MRCLIKLESLKDQAYDLSYHAKLQGVLYDILEDAGFGSIHDLTPFKFVCFSNIFPPEDMDEGEERTWIISSPLRKLIESVGEVISEGGRIEPGNQQYKVEDFKIFGLNPERKETRVFKGSQCAYHSPKRIYGTAK